MDTQLVRSLLGAMIDLENVPDPTLSYVGRLDLGVMARPLGSRRLPIPVRLLHRLSVAGPIPSSAVLVAPSGGTNGGGG